MGRGRCFPPNGPIPAVSNRPVLRPSRSSPAITSSSPAALAETLRNTGSIFETSIGHPMAGSGRKVDETMSPTTGPAAWLDRHAGRRGGRFVVRHPADLRPARAANRSGRPQPQGLAPAAPRPERPQLARPGDARHARQRRALSADRLVGAVPAHPDRSRQRAAARAGRRRRAPDAGAAEVSRRARSRSSGTPPTGSLPWPAAGTRPTRAQIRLSLQARQAALGTAVARLLVENNESEEQTAARVQDIYGQVQRQVYIFLAATFIAIVLTSLYLIRSNRRLFARLASLSNERREIAQQMIATRESTLREISRELPRRIRADSDGDGIDAGAAPASTRRKARRCAPSCAKSARSPRRRSTTCGACLRRSIRRFSRRPGLERTIEWYLSTLERQLDVAVSYEQSGTPSCRSTARSAFTCTACCRKR